MMMILYTKLGTMATEGKRKQVCKTDDTVNPGYENPGKEIRVKKSPKVEGGWGRWDPGLKSLLWASELSSGDATGGGCLLRGKHWTGSSILTIRYTAPVSMTEWKTGERSDLSQRQKVLLCTGKGLGLISAYVFTQQSQLPAKKHTRHVRTPVLPFRQVAYLGLSATSQQDGGRGHGTQ